MRRSFAFLGVVCALGLGATGTVAQQPAELQLFDLFEGDDRVDLRPGALEQLANTVRQTQRPDDCPLGELTLVQPPGDPLFYEAVWAARRDAVLGALDQLGINVAGRLFVHLEVGALGDFDAGYSAAPDDKPPVLETTSQPPKGTKVRAGERIVVRLTARDDADRWQTGVKTIQLVSDSEDGRFIASENYEPCTDPPEKRVEATYTVPSNPPPMVRLSALAEDHAGLMETDIGELPTGNLSGIWMDQAAGQEVRIVHSGDNVTATYLTPRPCDHSNGTGNQTYTDFDFSGSVDGEKLAGEIGVCKYGTADAGWVRVPLNMTVAGDWKALSGGWLNEIQQTWIPIGFSRVRDE